MKKIGSLLVMMAVIGSVAAGKAQAATIVDQYWGAEPTHNWSDRDVIGYASHYDISRMEVNWGAAGMSVDIYSSYLDNIGSDQTQLGDLFLSTDGWHPAGTGPTYVDDNFYATDAETWEYAVVLDSHLPATASGVTSGSVSLYRITDESRIELSSLMGLDEDSYVYRKGQEVWFNSAGLDSVATGSWAIHNLGGVDTDDFLRLTFDYDFGSVTEYGFHWAMTCGNDVIEGAAAAPVPEPATLALFGVGLVGLSGLASKRKQRKR